jgi:hypothetical protein
LLRDGVMCFGCLAKAFLRDVGWLQRRVPIKNTKGSSLALWRKQVIAVPQVDRNGFLFPGEGAAALR